MTTDEQQLDALFEIWKAVYTVRINLWRITGRYKPGHGSTELDDAIDLLRQTRIELRALVDEIAADFGVDL